MVDPVNLNIPGLPYFLLAAVFFAVVLVLTWVLSPLELLVRRHERSSDDGGGEGTSSGGDGDSSGRDDDTDTDGGDRENDHGAVVRFSTGGASTIAPAVDRPSGTVRRSTAEEASSARTYQCHHCGTTLELGDEWCPRCDTAAVGGYRTG